MRREAAGLAGHHTEAAQAGRQAPLYIPEFKTIIMPAVIKALDEWKGEADRSEDCM